MVLMSALSVFGNSCVLMATISSPYLHTPSHLLVGCLCFFDLLTTLLSMIPMAIACLSEKWPGGTFLKDYLLFDNSGPLLFLKS